MWYHTLLLAALAPSAIVQANSGTTRSNGGDSTPVSDKFDTKHDSSMACQVLECTLQVRQKYGQNKPLYGNTELDNAACRTCDLLVASNTLSHDLYGLSAADRVAQSGYNYRSTGENILYYQGQGGENARKACKQWEESPGHLQNMLKGSYTHHGACSCVGRNGRVYFAQSFGSGDSTAQYQCGARTSPLETGTKGTLPTSRAPVYKVQPAPTQAAKPAVATAPRVYGTGKPCVASGYGNKSPSGAGELKKRGEGGRSPRTTVA